MRTLFVGIFCIALLRCHAAPTPPQELELRTTFNLPGDLGIATNSMFNPRYFDGNVYANQISTPAFGRYVSGSPVPSIMIVGTSEHRMVAPFRGANATVYLFGSSGATTTTFSRYDFTGENRVDVEVPGGSQTAEGFDWVDENTIIYTTYNPSANRKRLSLAHVAADPFEVTADTRWNADGYVTTSVSTRIRNVRVGSQYSGYAYYGDAGQNNNPGLYALDLATGSETLLGNLGALTGSGSFGVWTVLERGGFLYVQTTDNGISIYNLTSATSLGTLNTSYTKERLAELTGYSGQFYGLDVSPDGKRLLLGSGQGLVYELAPIGLLKRVSTINLAADAAVGGSSMYNPRIFDTNIYVSQINVPAVGVYPLGSAIPKFALSAASEHRMLAPFRGADAATYLFASSGATTTTFSRYDSTGENRVDVEVPGDAQTSEGLDWVDANTIVYTTYNPSANRKRLSLAHVVADPFAVTADTRWNANGFITTSVSTRIRNVRVGDVYGGYAYYGDAGQNTNPNFYALNLATGEETLLGNAGTLTGTGSFGLWTVVERGGRLFVHTTDNGIRVYNLTSATMLGSLYATYAKTDLDDATGYTGQYWGFDVMPDGQTFVVAGTSGMVYQLAVRATKPIQLNIARAGSDVVLSWDAAITGAVVQSSATLSPPAFKDLDPQPTVVTGAGQQSATLATQSGPVFYRLRK